MRRSAILVLACLPALVASMDVQAQSVRLQGTGERAVSALPGDGLTIPFRLANAGAVGADVTLRAVAPPEVRTVLHGAGRNVPGGTAELVLVGVRVADGAPAGRHLLRLIARAEGGIAEDSVWIEVGARRGLDAALAAAPGVVAAGDGYAVRFRVRNTGNAAERIVVRASGDRGVGPVPAARTVELGAGEETLLEYSVDTGPLGHRNLRHQVVLRATAADGDTSVSAVARSLVEIVPRGPARSRRAVGFPLDVRLRTNGAGGSVGGEVRGGGLRGGTGIEFLARSADAPGAPFAREDEYHLRLASAGFEFRAGDGTFGISRIGHPRHRAAGGSAAARRGNLRVGGFFAGDRRSAWAVEAFGGFVRVGDERAGLGAIGEAGSLPGEAGVVSAEGWLRPGRLLWAAAELGLDGSAAGGAPPRHVALHGSTPRFWYDVVHLRPRNGVGGGSSVDGATASIRPGGGLSVLASYRRGADPHPDTVSAARALLAEQARARVELSRHLHAEVRSERRRVPAGFHTLRAMRVGVAVPLGPLRLAPAAEWGETGSGGDAAHGRPYRMRELRADVRAAGSGLTGRLRREEGWWRDGMPGGDRWIVGVDGWLDLGNGPRVRLSGGAARPDSAAAFAGFADLAIEQRLPRGHTLALRTLAGPGAAAGPMVRLEYRAPLSVPVLARRAEGLTVTVVDVATGRGVEGALVRVAGRTGFTGRGGVAVVEDVPAGDHPIRVERASLGPPWVTRSGASATVDVAADGHGRVRVEVAQGGTLSGRVHRVPAGAGAAREPLGGVELILEGDGLERRVTTGADGSYRFEGLWPGWWRLRVVQASLPRHHEPKDPSERFLVRPRMEEVADLQVRERERTVRYVDGGELTPQS